MSGPKGGGGPEVTLAGGGTRIVGSQRRSEEDLIFLKEKRGRYVVEVCGREAGILYEFLIDDGEEGRRISKRLQRIFSSNGRRGSRVPNVRLRTRFPAAVAETRPLLDSFPRVPLVSLHVRHIEASKYRS
jgi:hypothetical protein